MKTIYKILMPLLIAAFSLFIACDVSTGAGEDGFGYKPDGFTVTFNGNGGTPVPPYIGVQTYSKISAPTPPIKGYVFLGWFKDEACTDENEWKFEIDIVMSNITLYAKWGAYDGSFNLGDTGPGGGKVFYRNSSAQTMTDYGDFHYLEAAPVDMPPALAWQPAFNVTGTAATGIGAGRKNTALIHTHPDNTPAASACYIYSLNGKNDWFLPSKDELGALWTLYNANGKGSYGNLTTNFYWSSSEYGSTHAWSQSFGDGVQYYYLDKSEAFSVRAVRAF